MSFESMAWAAKQKAGGMAQKAVLMHLANCTNHQTGICRPRIKVIADECEMSESTVKKALNSLRDAGLVEVIPRFKEGIQLANDYRLQIDGVGRVATPGGSCGDPGVGRVATPVEPGRFEQEEEPEEQSNARAPEQTAPLTATPQSDGSSEGGEKRKPPRAAARTKTPPYPPLSPTLIEWMDHCREKWPLMPAFRAELAFAGYESKGWLRESSKGKFGPIVNWRGATHTSYLNWTKWHADEHTAAKRDQETRARNSQGGPFSERPNRGPFSE